MSYEPTVWKTGDVVTSAKLNKLENAVAGSGGVLVIDIVFTRDSSYLDIPAGELYEALADGYVVYLKTQDGTLYEYTHLFQCGYEENPEAGSHMYYFVNSSNEYYVADSSTDNPVYEQQ